MIAKNEKFGFKAINKIKLTMTETVSPAGEEKDINTRLKEVEEHLEKLNKYMPLDKLIEDMGYKKLDDQI